MKVENQCKVSVHFIKSSNLGTCVEDDKNIGNILIDRLYHTLLKWIHKCLSYHSYLLLGLTYIPIGNLMLIENLVQIFPSNLVVIFASLVHHSSHHSSVYLWLCTYLQVSPLTVSLIGAMAFDSLVFTNLDLHFDI